METITLDQNAQNIAERMATKRHDSFDHDDFAETALGKSSFDVHLIGAKAEVAVSIYYNLLVDMTERRKGDRHDFLIDYGRPVSLDVKCTTYRPAWLQVRKHKTESDYYLATYLDGADATTVELLGWAGRSEVLDGDVIRSPGGGDHYNYRLWKDELSSLPPQHHIFDASMQHATAD